VGTWWWWWGGPCRGLTHGDTLPPTPTLSRAPSESPRGGVRAGPHAPQPRSPAAPHLGRLKGQEGTREEGLRVPSSSNSPRPSPVRSTGGVCVAPLPLCHWPPPEAPRRGGCPRASGARGPARPRRARPRASCTNFPGRGRGGRGPRCPGLTCAQIVVDLQGHPQDVDQEEHDEEPHGPEIRPRPNYARLEQLQKACGRFSHFPALLSAAAALGVCRDDSPAPRRRSQRRRRRGTGAPEPARRRGRGRAGQCAAAARPPCRARPGRAPPTPQWRSRGGHVVLCPFAF
jgi:hypothetical protein